MKKKELLYVIIGAVIILAVLYWFNLPAINPLSPGFWWWILISLGIDWFILYFRFGGKVMFGSMSRSSSHAKITPIRREDEKPEPEKEERKIPFRVTMIPVGILAVIILGGFLSWSAFHAGAYSSRMIPTDGSASDLPTSDDVDHISLMDTGSASILGDRVIGSLSDLVSQFEVSDDYTTLVYQDTIVKIAPLNYGGFFKFLNNAGSGTPGYVMVDTQSFDAKFVRLDSGIKYSPSGYFFNYLKRHLHFQYPTAMMGDSKFEIDEEGKAHWITPVYGHLFLFGGEYIKGAIDTDPSTGKSVYYDGAQNIPEWVDNVYTGDFACELYDSYGMLRNGWINSWIGQKGCLKTTSDFGYLAKGNDLYIYTGITSVAADQSNLGFIMVDARTGACTYVECAGAEEYSAMSAAEGVVQDFGYSASFPSLVTVNGIPSYALVLKDSAGLVKEYSIVNVSNYTVVSVGTTFAGVLKDYSRKLASGEDSGSGTAGATMKKTIRVKSVVFADTDGNTFAYLVSEEGTVYKIAVSADETIVAVTAGDSVEVEYPESYDGEDVIAVDSAVRK
jgi:hypothetical protein